MRRNALAALPRRTRQTWRRPRPNGWLFWPRAARYNSRTPGKGDGP